MQEWGRRTYSECMVCRGELSCLHHYFPKSTSSALRYEKDNLIPLCVSCHFRHHKGDPRTHDRVRALKGKPWLTRLYKKKEGYVKPTIKYYKSIIKKYGQ